MPINFGINDKYSTKDWQAQSLRLKAKMQKRKAGQDEAAAKHT